MRKLSLFMVLAVASFSLAAQQPQPKQAPPQTPGQKSASKQTEERLRADGAAGGTAPLPDEKRKAVGAGAGPHMRDHLPSPQKLPRDEPVEPPK